MKNGEPVALDAFLGGMVQSYYALYVALKRKGLIEAGDVATILRASIDRGDLSEGTRQQMEFFALELDGIDRGGRPEFGVIDGGKSDP